MVQAWYQGGISIMDFTDAARPVEVAYFDRGPINPERLVVGGSWSAYWFNGRIYSSEIARGLDVLKLVPSDQLSAAEIAVAEAVMIAENNPQTQTRITWEDSPEVAQVYVDQLARSTAVDAALLTQARAAVDQWKAGGTPAASTETITALTAAAEKASAPDAARMTALAGLLQRRSA
ncbi:MAG: hypothetical protein ACOH2M_10020 [Cypionkella sp.]